MVYKCQITDRLSDYGQVFIAFKILCCIVYEVTQNLFSDSREKVGEVGELAGPRAVMLAAAGQVGAVTAPRIWTWRGDMGQEI